MTRATITAMTVCSLLVAGAVICPAGEIKPRAKKAPPKHAALREHTKTQYRRDVARFPIAALVKVVEAGGVFEEKDRPQLPDDNRNAWRMQQFGARAQRVLLEVSEPLRGLDKVKQVEVMVRHLDVYGAQRLLQNKDPKRVRPKLEDSVAEAGFFKGEKYLVFLAEDQNLKPGKGRKGPVYSTVRMSVYGSPADVVSVCREMAAKIRAYDRPPVATKGQLAEAGKRLKELESTTFAVRDKAHSALLKTGPVLMKFLKEASTKATDLEVRLRCVKLLDDMKPLPGANPDSWAGKYIIKKIEEKKEDEEEKAGEDAAVRPAVVK